MLDSISSYWITPKSGPRPGPYKDLPTTNNTPIDVLTTAPTNCSPPLNPTQYNTISHSSPPPTTRSTITWNIEDDRRNKFNLRQLCQIIQPDMSCLSETKAAILDEHLISSRIHESQYFNNHFLRNTTVLKHPTMELRFNAIRKSPLIPRKYSPNPQTVLLSLYMFQSN